MEIGLAGELIIKCLDCGAEYRIHTLIHSMKRPLHMKETWTMKLNTISMENVNAKIAET